MTLFQLSYWLLWTLAIVLVPVCGVLFYLLVELDSQKRRDGQGFGNNLIGRSLSNLVGTSAETGIAGRIESVARQTHVMLAVSPGCGSCVTLIDEVASAATRDIAGLNLVVLCMGESTKCREKVQRISAPAYIVSEKDDSNSDLWLVGFPAALVVDQSGTVADIRHPVSLKGLTQVVSNATVGDGGANTSQRKVSFRGERTV